MLQRSKIYIGNLPFSINKAAIIGLFEIFGNIVDIRVPMNKETGKKRGFAFVTFDNQYSATDALSLNGKELDGRIIKVDIAQSDA